MDLSKIKLFNLMQSNLNYLNAKQDVIAQNIAHANVADYSAKTLKKPDFSSYLSSSSAGGLATTNSGHITGTSLAGNKFGRVVDSDSFEVSPTGNKVVLEEQVLEMTKNSMEYQETANIYRKMLEMLKTSIGGQ